MSWPTPKHEIDRIIHADHHDPYNVLGIHESPEGVVVRAFDPAVAEIAVVDIYKRESRYIMERLDLEGFFEVFIPGRKIFAYDLHKVNHRGEHTINRDPYSFLPQLGEMDLYLFNEGNHYEIHKKLGAHIISVDGVPGTRFAVWAPNARRVSVVGDFNEWDGRRNPMRILGSSGVWEIFIPGVGAGAVYKFELKSQNGDVFLKSDPYAYASELRPKTASQVWNHEEYQWDDAEWIAQRGMANVLERPMAVYEAHLGSWAKSLDGSAWLSYRELAPLMVEYCKRQGFTHIELMPLSEHPFDASWGYQVTGYFAPTSRFGAPDDFKFFVDFFHNHGIGIIMDWVPAHFPKDDFGLRRFDGTALYEHEDWRKGEHLDWGTLIYNYGRPEVANFLLSSVLFWMEYFHLDGIRVDAVASMLYLDYSKKHGEWVANPYGGKENIEAIEFLKKMNALIHDKFPGSVSIAEESTAWAGVSRPVYLGGLGFTMKWNMGWMHDILEYFSKEPIHRKYHHSNLTFAMLYAFHENFMLPLSHDEVVHGKNSLIGKMPGDLWQKFANMRLLFGYMYAQPGKKLIFQGGDIGQWSEWDHDKSVDWHLLQYAPHARLQKFMADLGNIYINERSMWEVDFSNEGFEWIDFHDWESSIVSFMRKAKDWREHTIFAFNFTPVPRWDYRIGVPEQVFYEEALNSDSEVYYGSNLGNFGGVWADPIPWGGKPASINITLPPLSMVMFRPKRG
ncbi:MAG: 1,4-alpha-glucan branching protein GlgB [Nitrospinae bacterium]|nr:1,4-alpha-glucan branching protein GlgB [Nitrospinota bacterium]